MSGLGLCLWFDGQAEDAARHYVEIFRDAGRPAAVDQVVNWGKVGPGKEGTVVSVAFTLDGQKMLGLNGGPMFTFTPAISLMVDCDNQGEIDHFWARLTDGGKPSQCGWLTDKFGVAWQVVPKVLGDMMRTSDATTRDRIMAAFMPMTKLDIATIERAYKGD